MFPEKNPGQGPSQFDFGKNVRYQNDQAGGEQTLQDQLNEANERLEEAQSAIDSMHDRNSPLGKMIGLIESGKVTEMLRTPEKREELEEMHEEIVRSLYEPVIGLAKDARTHLVPQGWPMQHEGSSISRIASTIKTKSSVHRPYKPERAEHEDPQKLIEIKKILTKKEHIHDVFTSRMYAEATTIAAHQKIMEGAFGPMSLYFDGKGMMGLNPRRLTVPAMEDYRQGFNVKKDKVLKVYMSAQKDEAGSDPANKIENAPSFFEEGYSDMVKKYAAEMIDLHNVIGEMNHRDPFAEGGQDMRIKVSDTEQEFIASLFKRIERTDEYGKVESLKLDEQSTKIVIYFDKDNKQIPIDDKGRPLSKPDRSKNVYIHTLAYENTVRSEDEHKRWMSLLMAYSMSDTRSKLQEICLKNPNILSVTDVNDSNAKEFKALIAEVDKLAKDLVDDWDSPRVSKEREAAASAVELNHMVQIGTLNIANLGHISHWDRVEIMKEVTKDGKTISEGTGQFIYKFLDETGDPDMALDAVSAMFTMQHEFTYLKIKDRIGTPLLPPADPRFVEKVINMTVHGGRDPELLAYAEKSEYIARGYGLIGMFADKLKDNPVWKEGEAERKKLGLECNSEVIQVLEQTMFGVPTVFDGEVFPMPINALFRSQSLFDSMHISKTRTVQDVLNDRVLMTQIDWGQYHPFAEDGRAVVGKFTTDITALMYGAADKKTLDALFSSAPEFIHKVIKAMDIGPRADVQLFEFTDSEGNKSVKPINKKVYEVTYSSYLCIAYLAFYKHGLWDGNEKFSRNLVALKDGVQGKGLPGLNDFLEADSYLLKEKQGFKNYSDSHVLVKLGLTEFVKGIGVKADKGYSETERFIKKVDTIVGKK